MELTKEITIILEHGVIFDVFGIPPSLQVKVLDYDLDGGLDDDGIPCCISIWKNEK